MGFVGRERLVRTAVYLVVAFTFLLSLLGYEHVYPYDWRPWLTYLVAPSNGYSLFVLCIPLAGLGVLLEVAREERLYRSSLGALTTLVLVAILGAMSSAVSIEVDLPSPIGFGAIGAGHADLYYIAPVLALVAAAGSLAVATEYLLVKRESVASKVAPRSRYIAAGVGVGHVLVVGAVSVFGHLREYHASIVIEYVTAGALPELFIFALSLTGLLVSGAVPALLVTEYRLLTPGTTMLVLLGYFAFGTWRQVTRTRVPTLLSGGSAAPVPIDAYTVFWFVPLGIALFVGAFEYDLQSRLSPTEQAAAGE